jgi:hypothetical protein
MLHVQVYLRANAYGLAFHRGSGSASEWTCVAIAGGVPKHAGAVSRHTQQGVLARPLTRTFSGGEVEFGVFLSHKAPGLGTRWNPPLSLIPLCLSP